MAQYLQFIAADGTPVLVEVAASAPPPTPQAGPMRAGLEDRLQNAVDKVVRAAGTLDDQLLAAIRTNAQALVHSVTGMPQPPQEIEVNFGITLTLEGNAAVCKAAAEATYGIKLVWKCLPGPRNG